MSINFLKASCQEPTLNEKLFGLCDDQQGLIAYTNLDDNGKWIATVKNDKSTRLIFTAIDKCIIKDNEQIGRGRCDCMLTSEEHIIFVELKDQRKSWVLDATAQLESTVQLFIENHAIGIYKHKKVYACNKQQRHFQEVDHEINLRFFRKYGVRIDVQSEIIVI